MSQDKTFKINSLTWFCSSMKQCKDFIEKTLEFKVKIKVVFAILAGFNETNEILIDLNKQYC